VNLTTHLHLVPRSKNAWRYNSTPAIRLHGVVLGYAQGKFYLLPLHFIGINKIAVDTISLIRL
jgi:hypothetical protein